MSWHSEKIELIAEWQITVEKLREINKYLYERTELYESKYMDDFETKQFMYFAGKINQFTKWLNQLNEILSKKEKKEIRLYKLKK